MLKIDYNSPEFSHMLDEYFKSEEFKQWADFWFPDEKVDDKNDV